MASIFAGGHECDESQPGERREKDDDGDDVQHGRTSVSAASGMNTAISFEAIAMPRRSEAPVHADFPRQLAERRSTEPLGTVATLGETGFRRVVQRG